MLEVVFVCTVFAMLISGIILAINRSYVFMNNTRVQIRATNLTREGVEMVFNIRDTNRRKCSWKRDNFWLYVGSWASNESNCNITIDNMFKEWIYAIKEWVVNGEWDKLIYAERLNRLSTTQKQNSFYQDFDSFFSDDNDYKESREKSRVVFTWTYMYYSGGITGTRVVWEIGDLLWDWIEYYRILRVYGIYDKTANNPDSKVVDASALTNSTPKEMRFCVKTIYNMGAWYHSSELCSIMTNFME